MWHPDNCIYHYHQHLSIITIIRLCRYQLAGKCSKSLFERQVGSDKTLAFMSLTHLWNPNSCAGPSVCWGYCCNPTDIGLCLPPVQLCLREMFLSQTPVCSFSVCHKMTCSATWVCRVFHHDIRARSLERRRFNHQTPALKTSEPPSAGRCSKFDGKYRTCDEICASCAKQENCELTRIRGVCILAVIFHCLNQLHPTVCCQNWVKVAKP